VKDSSFCEQKEAKKLHPIASPPARAHLRPLSTPPMGKVFFASFLFTKKKTLS
jgi:hypothetical protein